MPNDYGWLAVVETPAVIARQGALGRSSRGLAHLRRLERLGGAPPIAEPELEGAPI